jgi:hypothetical protein
MQLVAYESFQLERDMQGCSGMVQWATHGFYRPGAMARDGEKSEPKWSVRNSMLG